MYAGTDININNGPRICAAPTYVFEIRELDSRKEVCSLADLDLLARTYPSLEDIAHVRELTRFAFINGYLQKIVLVPFPPGKENAEEVSNAMFLGAFTSKDRLDYMYYEC